MKHHMTIVATLVLGAILSTPALAQHGRGGGKPATTGLEHAETKANSHGQRGIENAETKQAAHKNGHKDKDKNKKHKKHHHSH
jgi:hypothetical protein